MLIDDNKIVSMIKDRRESYKIILEHALNLKWPRVEDACCEGLREATFILDEIYKIEKDTK